MHSAFLTKTLLTPNENQLVHWKDLEQNRDSLRQPWTIAHQASLSMGFSRPEYWSGLPFPSPTSSMLMARV